MQTCGFVVLSFRLKQEKNVKEEEEEKFLLNLEYFLFTPRFHIFSPFRLVLSNGGEYFIF